MTSLACQVGGALARTRECAPCIIFIAIFILDSAIDHGAQEEIWYLSPSIHLESSTARGL